MIAVAFTILSSKRILISEEVPPQYCHNAFATVNLLVQWNINKQMPFPLIVFTVLVTVFAEHGT